MDQSLRRRPYLFVGKEFPRRFQEGSAEIIVPYRTTGSISSDGINMNKSVEVMWDYFVQNQVLLRTFHGFSGVGKHFSVNQKRIFSSEIHPMSGIQSLYDAMGKKIIGYYIIFNQFALDFKSFVKIFHIIIYLI